MKISTLLGSCVAITLWHPTYKVGGMCHFVLPLAPPDKTAKYPTQEKSEGYYGDRAISLFEKACLSRGLDIGNFQAKVFGGSNALQLPDLQDQGNIGIKNYQAAFRLLQLKGLPIIAKDIGSNGSRRITLDLQTGDVWVKYQQLSNSHISKRGNNHG